MPRYGEGGIDRLLERRGRDIRGARVAAPHFRPLAEVNRDADGPVAVVLDGFGLAFAHRDGKAVAFRHFALATACAGSLRACKHLLGHVVELRRIEGKPVALRHGGAMITAMSAVPP